MGLYLEVYTLVLKMDIYILNNFLYVNVSDVYVGYCCLLQSKLVVSFEMYNIFDLLCSLPQNLCLKQDNYAFYTFCEIIIKLSRGVLFPILIIYKKNVMFNFFLDFELNIVNLFFHRLLYFIFKVLN